MKNPPKRFLFICLREQQMPNSPPLIFFRLIIVIGILFNFTLNRGTRADDQATRSLLGKIKDRCETVKSLRTNWKITEHLPTGGFHESPPSPSSPLILEHHFSLLILGQSFKVSELGTTYVEGVGVSKVETTQAIRSHGGRSVRYQNFYKNEADGTLTLTSRIPNARISSAEEAKRHLNVMVLRPMMDEYRFFSVPSREIDVEGWRIIAPEVEMREIKCMAIANRAKGGKRGEHRLWINPVNGQVHRFELLSDDKTIWRHDCVYREGRLTGWRGSEYHGNGKLWRTYEAVELDTKLNAEIADKEFEIEFPAGSKIRDDSHGKNK
jgi:hypothetical protein